MPFADELPVRVVHPIERLRALSTQSQDAMDAWARHAAAANGFGEPHVDEAPAREPMPSEANVRRPVSFELWHAARAARAHGVGKAFAEIAEGFAAIVWVTVWLIGALYRSWQRRRAEATTYESLASLDDRVLRDMGLDRSELTSVAAEVHGGASATRMQAAAAFARTWCAC